MNGYAAYDGIVPAPPDALLLEQGGNAHEQGRAMKQLACAFAAAAAALGFAALLGWVLELPLLASWGPRWIPMAPSTAFLFVLFGTAVFINARVAPGRVAYRIGMAIGSAGALLALLLLFLSYRGIYLEAEHYGTAMTWMVEGVPKGHISPLTALCAVLAGLSLVASLASFRHRRWATAGFWLGALVVVAGFVFLVGYLYAAPLLYGGKFIPPALPTSLALVALGGALCLLAIAPEEPLDAAFSRTLHYLVFAFALAAAVAVTTGYVFYRGFEKQERTEVERQLSAISALKVGELTAWRAERLADASEFFGNAVFSSLVRRAFADPLNYEARAQLDAWLRQAKESNGYEWVYLTDAEGVARVGKPSLGQSFHDGFLPGGSRRPAPPCASRPDRRRAKRRRHLGRARSGYRPEPAALPVDQPLAGAQPLRGNASRAP
jgi:hypothetical protein